MGTGCNPAQRVCSTSLRLCVFSTLTRFKNRKYVPLMYFIYYWVKSEECIVKRPRECLSYCLSIKTLTPTVRIILLERAVGLGLDTNQYHYKRDR